VYAYVGVHEGGVSMVYKYIHMMYKYIHMVYKYIHMVYKYIHMVYKYIHMGLKCLGGKYVHKTCNISTHRFTPVCVK